MTYEVAFQALLGAMMLVAGAMLGRMWTEIDRLRQADIALAKELAALKPMMIDREAFERHTDREEREISSVREGMADVLRAIQALEVVVARLAARNGGGDGGGATK